MFRNERGIAWYRYQTQLPLNVTSLIRILEEEAEKISDMLKWVVPKCSPIIISNWAHNMNSFRIRFATGEAFKVLVKNVVLKNDYPTDHPNGAEGIAAYYDSDRGGMIPLCFGVSEEEEPQIHDLYRHEIGHGMDRRFGKSEERDATMGEAVAIFLQEELGRCTIYQADPHKRAQDLVQESLHLNTVDLMIVGRKTKQKSPFPELPSILRLGNQLEWRLLSQITDHHVLEKMIQRAREDKQQQDPQYPKPVFITQYDTSDVLGSYFEKENL